MARSTHPSPLAVWQVVVGHQLREPSAADFRSRSEHHALASIGGARLLLAAVLAAGENDEGHLLLTEWNAAAHELGDVYLGDLEQAVSERLTLVYGSLDTAVAFARDVITSRKIRLEIDEALTGRIQQGLEAERQRQDAATKSRLERDALLAERAESRLRQARAKQRRDAEMRAHENTRDASDAAKRAQEDRKRPPVHDIPYKTQPWEEW